MVHLYNHILYKWTSQAEVWTMQSTPVLTWWNFASCVSLHGRCDAPKISTRWSFSATSQIRLFAVSLEVRQLFSNILGLHRFPFEGRSRRRMVWSQLSRQRFTSITAFNLGFNWIAAGKLSYKFSSNPWCAGVIDLETIRPGGGWGIHMGLAYEWYRGERSSISGWAYNREQWENRNFMERQESGLYFLYPSRSHGQVDERKGQYGPRFYIWNDILCATAKYWSDRSVLPRLVYIRHVTAEQWR